MSKRKLAIISSHPIQYNAPMFALLSKSDIIEPKVFYTWSQSTDTVEDKDFGKKIQWDIPLLDGYQYEIVENISADPGPHHRNGIDCPTLNKSIEDWGADALMVFGWNYKAHYNAMKHFKGSIPVYFRGDSTLIDETGGIKQLLRRCFLRWVYRSADFAFYVGKNNKEYFLKHGFTEEELFFAPHAIDNQRFNDSSGDYTKAAALWRTELGISQDEVVVVFVGKFEPKKNPLLLLHAAKKLNNPKVHFVFVGNGLLEEEMKKEAKGMDNIHFVPFQNQSRMPVVYYLSDILALPSQGPGETWGLVVNEAMACGRAVLVSTKAGCFSDLVENGKNGYVFESGEVNDCVSALEKMSDKQSCKKMGLESQQMIKKWSFAEIVKSIEKHIGN